MEVAKGALLKAIAEVKHSPQVHHAAAPFMVTAWVIDSNCFIHMGQVGDQRLKPDLEGVIGGGHSKAYIASDSPFQIRISVRWGHGKAS